MSDQAKKILIVDDDVDFIQANKVALESMGFEVITATDSRQGVELAAQEKPDLITLDLMMEKMYSGFSVVEALNAHEETAGIPIIMISAVTTETGFRVDTGGQKPEWLDVVEFVHKPIDPVDLAKKVASILEGKS
ncbi:MAG: response regulator [Armatimonadetes bacterium]|jgi:CheY-like chemotaxis protein|nr:response regulator [Armatimonadota bacterium]MDI9583461.1 response regulator [Acidobacteriota bacterium]